jgi:hypothetical protein
MKHSKQSLRKAMAKVRKAGSKDSSHASRVLNGGWRKGSVCFYIQQHLNQPAEVIAKAIMKKQGKNAQSCFSTLPKAIARVNTIKRQAKSLGIRKAR